MDHPKQKSSNKGLIIGILAAFCCICAMTLVLGGYAYYYLDNNFPATTNCPFSSESPQPPVTVTRPPVETIPLDTLDALGKTVVPDSDLYDLSL